MLQLGNEVVRRGGGGGEKEDGGEEKREGGFEVGSRHFGERNWRSGDEDELGRGLAANIERVVEV